MKRKIEKVILALLVLCFAFLSCNYLGVFTKDFSDTKLVYENSDRYYYDHLTDNAKIAYTLILPELYEHSEKIEIPEITDDEFDSLMYALSYDNPDLICYGRQSQIKYEKSNYWFYATYSHSKSECPALKQQLDAAVSAALSEIDKNDSEYEKELYVHDYICRNCEYVDDGENLKVTAYDALVSGEAVCEGYARAAQLLLSKLGIKNYLVIGDAENELGEVEGHMWNIVTIDGKNYHLDVTWDDMDAEDEQFTDCHIYFNVSDELISRNHRNISPQNNNCVSMDMNYYTATSMIFTSFPSTVETQLEKLIYQNYKQGINSCEFCFSNLSAYSKAKKKFVTDKGVVSLMQSTAQKYGDMGYTNVQYLVDDKMFVIKFVFS